MQVDAQEPKRMAKAQKTMMVPEDLYKLIASQERTKGATFTRQAVAALLAYFFTEPDGPDPLWMEAVVAVENGDLKIGQVPQWYAKNKFAETNARIAQCESDMRSEDPAIADPADMLRKRLVTWDKAKWSALVRLWSDIENSANDTVDGLIARWYSARMPSFIIGPSVPLNPDGTTD